MIFYPSSFATVEIAPLKSCGKSSLASSRDAIQKTDMDGFMVDWLWNPTAAVCGPAREQRWLECEQQMFVELMEKPFPGKENVSPQDLLEYNRRAIDRCWKTIHETTKTTKPDCLIWLSCSELENPEDSQFHHAEASGLAVK